MTALHYVCTHDHALALINAHDTFYLSNCGCRESKGQCARSRMDVCLIFSASDPGSGSGLKKISRSEAEAVFHEAVTRRLVARPFRDAAFTQTDGICFCCDDCCGYFLNREEICDKGDHIEKTDWEKCTHCGVCVPACYFHARQMIDTTLVVQHDDCYGCGLCIDACPIDCINMIIRKE